MKIIHACIITALLCINIPLSAEAAGVDNRSSTATITLTDTGETKVQTTSISDTTMALHTTPNIRIYAKSLNSTPLKLSIVDPNNITISETSDNRFNLNTHARVITLNPIDRLITEQSLIEIDNTTQAGVDYTIVNGP